MSYRQCCLTHARNPDFLCCPACGTPLLRCGADGCIGLTDLFNHCPVCLTPALVIDTGNMVRCGEQGLVKARLGNNGFQPFRLRHLEYRFCGDEAFIRKDTPTSVPVKQMTELYLDGFTPGRAGRYLFSVRLVLESRGETFVFQGEAPLAQVKESAKREIRIENVNLSDQAGIVVSAPDYGLDEPASGQADWQPVTLAFAPGEGYGYPDASYLSRRTPIYFRDVETGEQQTLRFIQKTSLTFGRNRPSKDPRVDVMLRACPRSEINDRLTRSISGRHFDLVLRSGRLFLRDHSFHGSMLNNQKVPRDHPVELNDGDVVAPFGEMRYVMLRAWRVRFQKQEHEITAVELQPNW